MQYWNVTKQINTIRNFSNPESIFLNSGTLYGNKLTNKFKEINIFPGNKNYLQVFKKKKKEKRRKIDLKLNISTGVSIPII